VNEIGSQSELPGDRPAVFRPGEAQFIMLDSRKQSSAGRHSTWLAQRLLHRGLSAVRSFLPSQSPDWAIGLWIADQADPPVLGEHEVRELLVVLAAADIWRDCEGEHKISDFYDVARILQSDDLPNGDYRPGQDENR
jgi:hypothetical protein